jgi:hypothetical protein
VTEVAAGQRKKCTDLSCEKKPARAGLCESNKIDQAVYFILLDSKNETEKRITTQVKEKVCKTLFFV